METLKSSLLDLKRICVKENIFTLSIPKIGCGLDGLRWGDVSNLVKVIFGCSNFFKWAFLNFCLILVKLKMTRKSISRSSSRSRLQVTRKKRSVRHSSRSRYRKSLSRKRSLSLHRSHSRTRRRQTRRKTSSIRRRSKSPIKKRKRKMNKRTSPKIIATSAPPPVIKEIKTEVTALVVDSDKNKRIITVNDTPLQITVVEKSPESHEVAYVVENLEKREELPVPVVVNTRRGTISTTETETQVASIQEDDEALEITVKPPVKKSVSRVALSKPKQPIIKVVDEQLIQSKSKSSGWKSKVVIAILLALLGSTSKECKLTETKEVQEIFSPHNFVVSALKPLGVENNFMFANTKVLQTVKSAYSDELNRQTVQSIKNSRDAYQFGAIVADVKNTKVINDLRGQIKNLNVELKNVERVKNKLVKESSSIMHSLANADEQLLETVNVSFSTMNTNQLQHMEKIIDNRIASLNDLAINNTKTADTLSDLLSTKFNLQSKMIVLNTENVVDQDTKMKMKEEIEQLQSVIANLSKSKNIQNQQFEEEKQKMHKNMNEQIAKLTAEQTEKVDGIMKQNDKKVHESFLRGRTEMAQAMEKSISSLQQKLNMANKKLVKQTQYETSNLITILQNPGGTFSVKYDKDKFVKTSPILADYVENLAKEVEVGLNSGKFSEKSIPKTLIDITIDQKMIYRGWFSSVSDYILGTSKTNSKRFHMVRVAGTDTTPEMNNAPFQSYEYLPIDVSQMPALKEVLQQAAMASVTTKTVTITSVHESTATVTTTATATTTESISLPKETSTVTIKQYSTATSVPSTNPDIDQPNDLIREEIVKNNETITVKKINTPTFTSVTSSTAEVTIISKDPTQPVVSIQAPIPTVDADMRQNLSNVEKELSNTAKDTRNVQDVEQQDVNINVGKTESGDTVVQNKISDTSGCNGQGLFGAVLSQTQFCVEDFKSHIMNLRRMRIMKTPAPDSLPKHEQDYVNRKRRHPFEGEYLVEVFGTIPGIKVREYFEKTSMEALNEKMEDIRHPEDASEIHPSFTNEAFLRAMEFPKLAAKRKYSWGFLTRPVLEEKWLEVQGSLDSDTFHHFKRLPTDKRYFDTLLDVASTLDPSGEIFRIRKAIDLMNGKKLTPDDKKVLEELNEVYNRLEKDANEDRIRYEKHQQRLQQQDKHIAYNTDRSWIQGSRQYIYAPDYSLSEKKSQPVETVDIRLGKSSKNEPQYVYAKSRVSSGGKSRRRKK